MKNRILLPLLMLFIFSCSEDASLFDENDRLVGDSELVDLRHHENPLSVKADGIVIEKTGLGEGVAVGAADGYDPWCVSDCNQDYKACFDWAIENKNYSLLDCESIIIIGVETVDIYCTETVIIGYNTVYPPEGGEIEVPIFGEVEVVCGSEEVNIITEDPGLLAQYEACKVLAFEEFVDELDKCDIKQIKCLKKCKKPSPQ